MHTMLTDLALKSTVVLAAASAAAFGMRRAPAALRHLLWTLVALALLLLPALDLWMPAWHVRSLPGVPAFRFVTQSATPHDSGSPASAPPGAPIARRGTQPAAPQPARTLDWLLVLWAAGAAVSLGRLVAGLAATGRLRRHAEPFGDIEGVSVLRSSTSTMPITLGIVHPAILLPCDAADWPEERRRIVIAHELAHIRRRDCLVQVVAQAAFSLYWFHPLTWWASRQLVREREHASDDVVLAAGVRASDYAALLLDVARSFQPVGVLATAGVAMARRSELEGRMLAILDGNLRRGVVSPAAAGAAAACALALVLPLAAMRPAPQAEESVPRQLSPELLQSTDYQHLDQVAKAELNARLGENAQRLYGRSLEVRLQKFGEQSPEFAAGLLNLATAYRVTNGQWQKAVALYRRALPIQEATLGPNHPDVATTLYYLGRDAAGNPHKVEDAAKHYQQAMPLYQRALDIRTKAFGASDPRVAEILIAMSRISDDESLYQRALSVVDTGAQPTSLTAEALEGYAGFLSKHERESEGVPLKTRAQQIRKERVLEIGARHGATPGEKAVKVGNGITPPKLAYKIEPQYTDEARSDKLQGTVVLYIEVGADGLAHNVRLIRGIGSGLDEKAAEAVVRWTFTPAMRDGQPVNVAATVEVNFRLL